MAWGLDLQSLSFATETTGLLHRVDFMSLKKPTHPKNSLVWPRTYYALHRNQYSLPEKLTLDRGKRAIGS